MAKSKRKDNGAPPTEAGDGAGAPQMSGHAAGVNGDRDRVAERAYQLYLERGGTDGRAMDDWLVAELEVRGRANLDPES
jgi:hypothetical protein